MPTATEVRAWLTERGRRDDQLYARIGRPLELEHRGELVAIGDDGCVLLGADELALATLAIERFGAGNYALRRIGAEAEGHALLAVR